MNFLEYCGIFGIIAYIFVGAAIFSWLRHEAAIGVGWTWYVAAFISCLIWGIVAVGILVVHAIQMAWMTWKVWRE